MITFIISLLALVAGYFIYGRIVERIFAPDNRPTPAVSKADGVDYIVMPGWKIFMIQFLNIAGTGPIFGAIMGAKFGPSAYLWIVFGCIFAGAMHDYLSGMLSIRHGGAGLPELVGHYLGGGTKKVMLVFSVFMLIMVGAVFVYSPALILGALSGGGTTWVYIWCGIIFVYYFLATMLPIDKIIGKIYPLFAIAMLFMAVALLVVLIIKWPQLPELGCRSNIPLPVHNDSLRGNKRIPCHTEPAHGALHGTRETGTPLVLRRNDNRGHRGTDLGNRIFLLLLRRSSTGTRRTAHATGSRGGDDGIAGLARHIRRRTGNAGRCSRTDNQRRHGSAQRTTHHSGVLEHRATLHTPPNIYLPAALPRNIRLPVV